MPCGETEDEKYPYFHFIFHLGFRQKKKTKKPTICEQGEYEACITFNELMYKNPAPIFWPIFYKYSLPFSSPTHPGQKLVSFLPNPCVFSSWTHCCVIFPTPLISGWAMGLSSGPWNKCKNKECLFWTWPPNHHLRFSRLSPPSSAARQRGFTREHQGLWERQNICVHEVSEKQRVFPSSPTDPRWTVT